MSSDYGGIVAIQTTGLYYGIQARLTMPHRYYVNGPDRDNYFDAYLALTNPYATDDPRAEAGIFKYGNRGSDWTYFLWPLAKPRMHHDSKLDAGWKEVSAGTPTSCHMKLIFVHDCESRVSFYVNGGLRWTCLLGRPISRQTYEKGGLAVKACIGMKDELKTVYFDDFTFSDILVCTDRFGAKWVPIGSVPFTNITKEPAPIRHSWNPLTASYTINGYPDPHALYQPHPRGVIV